MAILFLFPSSKARVRAMGSANWAEVPGGKGLASKVSKLVKEWITVEPTGGTSLVVQRLRVRLPVWGTQV